MKAIDNAYSNAENQGMKVAKFSSRNYYPNLLDEITTGLMFGYKWWGNGNGVKNIQLENASGYTKEEQAKFSSNTRGESVGTAFVKFALKQNGISDTGTAKILTNAIFGETTVGKITTTAINLFGIGRNISEQQKLVNEDIASPEKIGMDYLDKVFLMDPKWAEQYFGDFEIVNDGIQVKNLGLNDAALGMSETIKYRHDPMILQEMNTILTRIAGQATKLTLKMISFAVSVAK